MTLVDELTRFVRDMGPPLEAPTPAEEEDIVSAFEEPTEAERIAQMHEALHDESLRPDSVWMASFRALPEAQLPVLIIGGGSLGSAAKQFVEGLGLKSYTVDFDHWEARNGANSFGVIPGNTKGDFVGSLDDYSNAYQGAMSRHPQRTVAQHISDTQSLGPGWMSLMPDEVREPLLYKALHAGKVLATIVATDNMESRRNVWYNTAASSLPWPVLGVFDMRTGYNQAVSVWSPNGCGNPIANLAKFPNLGLDIQDEDMPIPNCGERGSMPLTMWVAGLTAMRFQHVCRAYEDGTIGKVRPSMINAFATPTGIHTTEEYIVQQRSSGYDMLAVQAQLPYAGSNVFAVSSWEDIVENPEMFGAPFWDPRTIEDLYKWCKANPYWADMYFTYSGGGWCQYLERPPHMSQVTCLSTGISFHPVKRHHRRNFDILVCHENRPVMVLGWHRSHTTRNNREIVEFGAGHGRSQPFICGASFASWRHGILARLWGHQSHPATLLCGRHVAATSHRYQASWTVNKWVKVDRDAEVIEVIRRSNPTVMQSPMTEAPEPIPGQLHLFGSRPVGRPSPVDIQWVVANLGFFGLDVDRGVIEREFDQKVARLDELTPTPMTWNATLMEDIVYAS